MSTIIMFNSPAHGLDWLRRQGHVRRSLPAILGKLPCLYLTPMREDLSYEGYRCYLNAVSMASRTHRIIHKDH